MRNAVPATRPSNRRALFQKGLSRSVNKESFMSTAETADIKEVVKQKYGEAALRVKSGGGSSCCGAAPGSSCADPITSDLYDVSQIGQIPEEALLASLG